MLDITDRVSGITLTLKEYINAYEQVIQYNIARGLLYNSYQEDAISSTDGVTLLYCRCLRGSYLRRLGSTRRPATT